MLKEPFLANNKRTGDLIDINAPAKDIIEKTTNLLRKDNVRFTPEYEYKSFFFTFTNDALGNYGGDESPNRLSFIERLSIADKILSSSDKTSLVFFFENKDDMQRVTTLLMSKNAPDIELKEKFLKNASDLGLNLDFKKLEECASNGRIIFKESIFSKELWAQDLMETTGFFDKEVRLISGSISFGSYSERGNPAENNLDGIKSVKIPLVLQGGNITKTECGGKRYIVVGANDIIETKKHYKENQNYNISEKEFISLYCATFGCDKVLMLGQKSDGELVEQDKELMFHIDQAVFFPKKEIAVVVKIDEKDKNEANEKF